MKNLFYFNDISEIVLPNDSYIVNIKKNLEEKKLLFNDYAEKLNFPAYFGKNWDAMIDCLSDLDEIKQKNILIIHEDLPFTSNKKEIYNYFDILQTAIERWIDRDGHKLYVYFPRQYKDEIDHIISHPNFGD